MRILTFDLFEAAKGAGPKPLTKAQQEFLDRYTKGTWLWNPETGLVDIEGDFRMTNKGFKSFKGVRFGKVSGCFDCHYNKLTSLEGAPKEVGRFFDCSYNLLTSLAGAPEKVPEGFYCARNQLTSLSEAPKEVGGTFDCWRNELTSLEGAPEKVGGDFRCIYNELTSLVGAPKKIGGKFESGPFVLKDWSMAGFLDLLNGGGEIRDLNATKRLIVPLLDEPTLDNYFKQNPLDLDLLDELPDIKKGVLARTGLKDTSDVSSLLRRGFF